MTVTESSSFVFEASKLIEVPFLVLKEDARTIADCNLAGAYFFGFDSTNELKGLHLKDLMSPVATSKLQLPTPGQGPQSVELHVRIKQREIEMMIRCNFHGEYIDGKLRITMSCSSLDNEDLIRQKYARLSAAIEYARDAVLITTADDPENLSIIYANASFKHLTGYSPEEAVGQDLSFVKITGRHRSRYEVLMESIKRGAPYAFECQVYRKDGTQFWADWHVSPVFDDQRRLTNWVIIKRDITIKKRILDEMTRQKLRYHEQLTHAMLHAQDQERQRIAEELHDSVGHNLSVMGMHLSLLKEKAQQSEAPDMLTAVNNLDEILTEATREVRNTSRNLSPSLLVDFGLEAAVRNLLSRLESAESMKVEYDLDHLERELPSNTQLSIYRIFQELVNNTMKHSGASTITLRITIEDDDALQLYYSDDGKGFDMEKVESQPGGLGLKNMLMRASVMDGFITFFSKPGEGMRVELRVPNITSPGKGQGLEFRPDRIKF